jgi:C4-dicarboxylate-specific signal transduction histidine kinase
LLETSHQAGMAEVATNVLHNVGNVLNSVNVSASLVADKLKASKVKSIGQVAELFRKHGDGIGTYLTADANGKQLPAYIGRLAERHAEEQAQLIEEIDSVRKNIEHIKDIVAMQQNYATISGVVEKVTVSELVEDALRMNAGALSRHDVELIREYAPHISEIMVEKHKVLQVLVNLIRNAKYACDESGRTDKKLTMRLTNGDDRVRISVIDNGIGIPAENMTRMFRHGFTTRKEGHGFGLHGSALAARQMGGALIAHSDGHKQGASFTLELPLKAPARE